MSSQQNTFRDWYRVFDLPFTATDSEIKQGYRQLMREWHPDKREVQTGYELHRSQELNEAYAVLRDPLKRAEYDKTYFAEVRKRADRLKAAANEAYRNNSFSDAVKLYSEAISYDPTNAVYYSNRSMAYGGLADWASARADAERAVSLNKSYMKGHYNLTRALVKLGLLNEADTVLLEALIAFPDDLDLRRLRQDLDVYLKKFNAKTEVPPLEKTANFGYSIGAAMPPRDKSPSLPSMTPPRKVSPRTPPSDEVWVGNSDPFVRAPVGQPVNPAAPPPPPPPKTGAGGPGAGESSSPFSGERPTKWRLGKSEEIVSKGPAMPNKSLGLSALRGRLYSRAGTGASGGNS